MATSLSFATINPSQPKSGHHCVIFRASGGRQINRIRCAGTDRTDNSSNKTESEGQNALLKIAWYGSELLGIAASVLRPPSSTVQSLEKDNKLKIDESGAVDRATVLETIKGDFARSYFVTGDLTLDAYEKDCEFADPAGSFKGLQRFKRNCTNFGLLIKTSNMKLTKWEDFEDKGIGHWRFSCIMSFPWKPILSGTINPFLCRLIFDDLSMEVHETSTGYTEYYFDEQTGKVCRHVEHWNVPKMALLKQILRPSRGVSA